LRQRSSEQKFFSHVAGYCGKRRFCHRMMRRLIAPAGKPELGGFPPRRLNGQPVEGGK
jgi:hypothetical protein